jgi:O-antigen/teichoic acid export membrane protein
MSHQKRKVLKGAVSNVVRVIVSLSFALILPPLLVRRLTPAEYGGWILILQGSAYIALLDLGLQTAISKFVAEYEAAGDRISSSRILSSSFALLCVSGLIGATVIAAIAWRVPELFRQMPITLIPSMREGILLVGLSAALSLPFNAFLATFTGLQEYTFPTVLAVSNKGLSSVALIWLALSHPGLTQLAAVVATANVATAIGQYLGWKRYARKRANFSIELIDRNSVVQLAKFGITLSVWTVAILFISGLDTIIVGHYDYNNTGYYGVATTVTNFMLLVVASLFGPLGPAISAMQSTRTSSQIGKIVVRMTRLSTLLLCLLGLPIILGAYPLLSLWVGHDYAIRSAYFLQILVIGNAIRQLGYPYAVIVIATGKQYQATIAAVAEAFVNLTASIYLVQRIGAIGVAIGTLVGALVSIAVHFAVSMKLTRSAVSVPRRDFVFEGILRPLTCVVPSLLLFPFWSGPTVIVFSPYLVVAWAITTLTIAWFVGLTPAERRNLRERSFQLVYWRSGRQ